ncbi:MAG: hypothetical protein HC828_09280 [Blastochloris sp.]|nr:hypothetical protein [Blastochloris sp.]
MKLFARTTDDTVSTQPSLRRRLARLAAPALIALSIAGSVVFPQAQAQAASKPDLDVISCTAVDDPIDYGDGIDWYKVLVTYENKGGTATGNFKYHMVAAYGVDMFSGQTVNEGFVTKDRASLAPGQKVSTFFWITKKTRDQKTWGIFLDNNGFGNQSGTVSESVETNNFCSAFANP